MGHNLSSAVPSPPPLTLKAPPPKEVINSRPKAPVSVSTHQQDSQQESDDPTTLWEFIKADQKFTDVPTVVSHTAIKKDSKLRIVCISDTHGKHRDLFVPDGDVLLHGGDFTNVGERKQVQDLHDWLTSLPHTHKVIIAGNHDITFETEFYQKRGQGRFHSHLGKNTGDTDAKAIKSILTESQSVTYLEDQGYTVPIKAPDNSTRTVAFWGSPYQPEFCDWAFNLPRGPDCQTCWQAIPSNTDILLTHGPPLGRGDLCQGGHRAGCYDLLKEIEGRIRPTLHLFGHVHEGYGVSSNGVTTFVNASSCNFVYRCIQAPIVLDLEVTTEGQIHVELVKSRLVSWSPEQVAAWVAEHRDSEEAVRKFSEYKHDTQPEQRKQECNASNESVRSDVAIHDAIFTQTVCLFLSQLSGTALLNLADSPSELDQLFKSRALQNRLIFEIRKLEAKLF